MPRLTGFYWVKFSDEPGWPMPGHWSEDLNRWRLIGSDEDYTESQITDLGRIVDHPSMTGDVNV